MQTSESAISACCCCCPLIGALVLKKSVFPADVALSAGLCEKNVEKNLLTNNGVSRGGYDGVTAPIFRTVVKIAIWKMQ